MYMYVQFNSVLLKKEGPYISLLIFILFYSNGVWCVSLTWSQFDL